MKEHSRSRLTFFICLFLFVMGCSQTKPDTSPPPGTITYRDLELKDYDEMRAIVKEHVNKAHKLILETDSNSNAEHDAKLELIKAERLILSRPNPDNMVSKLTPDVRREMAELGPYDELLEAMAREGIQAFNGDLNLPVAVQTTFLFVLENLMSELKPEITADARKRACLEQIRDANIQVSSEVAAERKLKSMYLTESPSEEAGRILEAAGFKKKR